MTKKAFDCVEMMHQAARHVQAELEGLSDDEKVQYFHQVTKDMREQQQRLNVEKEKQKIST